MRIRLIVKELWPGPGVEEFAVAAAMSSTFLLETEPRALAAEEEWQALIMRRTSPLSLGLMRIGWVRNQLIVGEGRWRGFRGSRDSDQLWTESN